MKAIRSNAKNELRANYKEYADKTQSFREWVKCESQSDPNFFSWLFDEELEEDFDQSLSEEFKKLFDNFLNSLEISKEQLIEFCQTQDYAFCCGGGLMYANEDEEREAIVDHLREDGMIVEAVGVSACEELAGEVENGCTLYKAYKWNEEAMYIAYYE